MTARIRAFFAIRPPDYTCQQLARLVKGPGLDYHGLRRVSVENLHLTVRFLGEVDEVRILQIVSEVDSALRTSRPMELAITGLAAFPPRRPRVIAAGIAENEGLWSLAETVEEAVVRCGLPAEDRAWRAHITLARLKHPPTKITLPDLEVRLGFRADKLVLFRSELHVDGARYSQVAEIPFEA